MVQTFLLLDTITNEKTEIPTQRHIYPTSGLQVPITLGCIWALKYIVESEYGGGELSRGMDGPSRGGWHRSMGRQCVGLNGWEGGCSG